MSVSCIIPAFNEAPRIAAVVEVVKAHPLLAEVIVVDDGSTDGTSDRAEAAAQGHPGVRIIRQPRNGGKSRAVATGIAAARGERILLLDSDLLGLTAHHLNDLLLPVIEGRAEAAISLRQNAPLAWRALGIDYISGERVMPRMLLSDRLEQIEALPRFGLEVFINRLWLQQQLRLAVVRWPSVDSPMKHEKRGGRLAGLRADAAMMGDIFRTVPPQDALRQIFGLRAQRV